MGFQINGTEVLGTSGIVNNANSFKTISGTSVLGTGNITDSGSANALLFNTVGSYTCAAKADSGLYQTSVSATHLYQYYSSSFGGFSYVTMKVIRQQYAVNNYHGLSGTWMHKSPYLSSANQFSPPDDVYTACYIASLWQRIA